MRSLIVACLASIFILTAFRENREIKITGMVRDEKGIPLSGVTVLEKQIHDGKQKATTTGQDGSFSLTVSKKNSVLVFLIIGYEKQEFTVGENEINIQIVMKPSHASLHEVVVTGYTTRKTNAKSRLTEDQYELDKKSGYVTPVLLNGRVSGLQVNPATTKNQPVTRGDYFDQNADTSVFNTEEYDQIIENRFLTATENPLSTFSIDVDGSSYSNARRYLQQGRIPPAGSVRIEEFINYFHYDYPQPKGQYPFSINTEIGECAWSPHHRLLMIGLQGRKIPMNELPASNLVFLIDVSGSMMEPEKLPLVQRSLGMLVDQLREQDRVSLVVYAGNAGLVLPSTPGNEKTKIKEAIDRLEAGGSTAGGAGILLAYRVAEQNFKKGGNNRVILCTDGDFNVGASSDADLVGIIEKKRKTGVFLTVMGFGMGNYKDSKMEKLADAGNGNHAYIDNENEARKVLVHEFGGTLFTIAKDVKLQIEFNPAKVQAYRLIGYENRMLNKEDFNNDARDAGELGSGHTVTALYEIIPVGEKNEFFEGVDSLRYQHNPETNKTNGGNELMTIKFRYKNPDGEKSQLIQQTVNDEQSLLNSRSLNFRFVSAVAQFGMLLRNSAFRREADYGKTMKLAKNALGTDAEGYRLEFLQLVKEAGKLAKEETSTINEELSEVR